MLVLGVAYKRDIDDIRESPALDIIRLLEEQGARVSYHDPHVPVVLGGRARVSLGAARSRDGGGRRLRHDRHRSLARSTTTMIRRNAKLVVDTRNAMPKEA